MTARADAYTALVTGSSAGLGAEFARQLAEEGHHLILVARDAGRLATAAGHLERDYGVTVEVLPADLTDDAGVAAVVARLRDASRPVDVLVNNAGIGLQKPFDENPVEDELKHLRLHVQTTLELCHAALQEMLPRGTGRIINVASVAAFATRGTYGAAKAWELSFSRWANVNYGPSGVKVTALCPGFTHTEFHQRMGIDKAAMPRWMWLDARRVVRDGLADNARGKAVSIPSLRYKAVVAATRLLPARFARGPARRPVEQP